MRGALKIMPADGDERGLIAGDPEAHQCRWLQPQTLQGGLVERGARRLKPPARGVDSRTPRRPEPSTAKRGTQAALEQPRACNHVGVPMDFQRFLAIISRIPMSALQWSPLTCRRVERYPQGKIGWVRPKLRRGRKHMIDPFNIL